MECDPFDLGIEMHVIPEILTPPSVIKPHQHLENVIECWQLSRHPNHEYMYLEFQTSKGQSIKLTMSTEMLINAVSELSTYEIETFLLPENPH